MPIQFTVLGSGSSGNCSYLEAGGTRILIDAGLSGRQIRHRLATIGRAPEGLTGILITHEHSDHTQGLLALAAKLEIPIYCNRLTKEAIDVQFRAMFDYRLFATGSTFDVGDVTVESFTVPHDAYDPVGFVVRTSGGSVGVLTDLGHATKLIVERVRTTNVLFIEANHDVKMLQDDSRRPWSLKQRILSRHGHLSNVGAADVCEQIVSAELRHLILGHLSRDCNMPDLAHRVVSGRMKEVGASHVSVAVSSQDAPLPCVDVEGMVSANVAYQPVLREEPKFKQKVVEQDELPF